jgi:hypothetical protein
VKGERGSEKGKKRKEHKESRKEDKKGAKEGGATTKSEHGRSPLLPLLHCCSFGSSLFGLWLWT